MSMRFAGIVWGLALTAAMVLAFILTAAKPQGGGRAASSGYAALVLGEDADERLVSDLLAKHKIRGVLSASNQSAYLNTFDGIEAVPLDLWRERVEPYDPRNDGYAEKALSVFFAQGKRRVFIPVEELSGLGAAGPVRKLENALEGTPYLALDYPQRREFNLSSVIIFIFAAGCMLFLARKTAQINKDRYFLFYAAAFIPSFFFLAPYPGGMAAAAVLTALFQINRMPLVRFLTGLSQLKTDGSAPPKQELTMSSLFELPVVRRFIREIAGEAQKLAVFVPLLLLIVIIAGIPLVQAALAVFFFVGTAVAIGIFESCPTPPLGHRRFVFVPLLSSRYNSKKFPVLPLPFLLGALLAAAFPQVSVSGGSSGTFFEGRFPLAKEDYARHLDFQKQFAYQKIGSPDGANTGVNSGYLHYMAGSDGLLESAVPYEGALGFPDTIAFEESPPWTLEPLARFFSVKRDNAAPLFRPERTGRFAGAFVAALFALCLYIPFVLRRHSKKNFFYAIMGDG